MWRKEYRFQRQSDDSFQFEFLIRLKLYTSVFRDSAQFMYLFSARKIVTEYDIKALLDKGQFSLPTARKSKAEEFENERVRCNNLN